ncbi:MAG: right-handed parallel beta-helix repeat-containing protein [Phycisphaerales bacterium]
MAHTPGTASSLYQITQPGSYYLVGNISAEVGKHGIEITCSDVRIDLRGFELVGLQGMGSFDGIRTTNIGLRNLEISSGSVRNWGAQGINLGAMGTSSSKIRSVAARDNASFGISTGDACAVVDCTASRNGWHGIQVAQASSVMRCGSSGNQAIGISLAPGCVVDECQSSFNLSIGISAGPSCRILDSNSHGNASSGIYGASETTIQGCSASDNGLHGIFIDHRCTVLSNTLSGNGVGSSIGAGLMVTGTGNHLDGNRCTNADRGVLVSSPGNFIVRNTCSANAVNWEVSAGNSILVLRAATSSGVFGDAGGQSPGSADPSANYSY